MGTPHIAIGLWLDRIQLPQYGNAFKRYHGVESILHLSEKDVLELGVTNGAHRARIVSSLVMLRDKLDKKGFLRRNHSTGGISHTCHVPGQLTHSNSISYPDYARLHVTNPLSKVMTSSPKPSFNIENHPWYHGSIPRDKAEKIVQKDGDFVVRNSISNIGDYVLTCRWKGTPLHFMINKQVEAAGRFTKLKYQFEEELFDSVPGLVNFYVTCKKPVSAASGAVLSTPVPRPVFADGFDLARLSAQNGSPKLRHTSPIYQTSLAAKVHNYSSNTGPKTSPILPRKGEEVKRRVSEPMGPRLEGETPQSPRARSVSPHPQSFDYGPPAITVTPTSPDDTYDNVISRPLLHKFRSGSDPNLAVDKNKNNLKLKSNLTTVPHGSESNLTKPPPPKPIRVPSVVYYKQRPVVQIRNKALWEDDDKDYSDYAQVKATPSIMLEERKREAEGLFYRDTEVSADSEKDHGSRVSRHRPLVAEDVNGVHHSRGPIKHPPKHPESHFNPLSLNTHLLPNENKPLDEQCLSTIITVLLKNTPTHLAENITRLDLDLLNILCMDDLGMNVTSGLELMTLPQGHQLRQDILERYHCLRLLVATVVLKCPTYQERSYAIRQWIKIALELKSTLGNILGFSAVMGGLEMPQILRLKHSWLALQQQYGDENYIYKMKLRPLMYSLNQGTASLPLQNVCVPHVVPLAELFERDNENLMTLTSWEENDLHNGLDIILAHLDTARIVTEQCGLYKIKGQEIVNKFQPDSELLDIFRTDLHLRLLWGAKGAGVNRTDRLKKFELILFALSERAEPSHQTESSL